MKAIKQFIRGADFTLFKKAVKFTQAKRGVVFTQLFSYNSTAVPWYVTLAQNFFDRVATDSGQTEAQTCLENRLIALEPYYERMSLLMLPHGYKVSKLYSIIPADSSGDFTFTRASAIATRKRSDGLLEVDANNIPRLDYTNGSCPELMLEPARTNSLVRSEEFDNASWVKNNVSVTPNNIIAPDGLSTADKMIPDAVLIDHKIYQAAGSANSTFSVFAKKGEYDKILLYTTGSALGYGFDLTNGTAFVVGGVGAAPSFNIKDYGNGWYRCSIFSVSIPTQCRVYVLNSTAFGAYSGNAVDGLYLWGAQVEVGSYASSYIPTTSASVARAQDSCILTSAAPLIGQTEGVLFLSFVARPDSVLQYFSVHAGSVNFRISIFINNLDNKINSVIQNTSIQGTLAAPSAVVDGVSYKVAVSYKSNYMALFINGVKIGEDLSVNVPATDRVDFSNSDGGSKMRGFQKAAGLFPMWMSDSECIALTT